MSTATDTAAELSPRAELTEIGWLLVVAAVNFLASLVLSQLGVAASVQQMVLPAATIGWAVKQHGVA